MRQSIDQKIIQIDKSISRNIENLSNDRGLLSQNILSQLRNLVEAIAVKIFSQGNNIELTYDNIKSGLEYVRSHGRYKLINRFHRLLQITVSHYTLDEGNSERLMLKYYEYLIKLRSFLSSEYSLILLDNLESFPIDTDAALKEYYDAIAMKVKEPALGRTSSTYKDRYYIKKIKTFFVEAEVFYEVTFSRAHDRTSKFDRIIAFTKLDIGSYYAVKLSVSNDTIKVLDKEMPILIIDNWEVSIRPCEVNNFSKIFGHQRYKVSSSKEYYNLLKFLTTSGLNLVEIIDLDDYNYGKFIDEITIEGRFKVLVPILNKCRYIISNKREGYNILRYLLFNMNNKIIKNQVSPEKCHLLSDLYLNYGCIPFDQMPFDASPLEHNPRLRDLFESLDCTNREHELFSRFIRSNVEIHGRLYTRIVDIDNFENCDELIKKFNDSLYYKHDNRRLETFKNHIYIQGYESDTYLIIKELMQLANTGIINYKNSVTSWLNTTAHGMDSSEKKDALSNLFEESKVALIYGAAGTGKSTMIKHISDFRKDDRKLYLANTNPAVDNLIRKVNSPNSTFKTISKFISGYNQDVYYDLIVIDECSTVNNKQMLRVLEKATFNLLILVGDVFQIESIRFGNWFSVIKSFIPNSAVFTLNTPFRSTNDYLLRLWDSVREVNDDILEKISKGDYSIKLDESIFQSYEDDEIILCLNYDGLYGVNNLNRFLQGSNSNPPIEWGIQTYKVGDPILFNENDRFSPLIYNNSKGRILGIQKSEEEIQFEIELDKSINEMDALHYDFELIGETSQNQTIIKFGVSKHGSTDEDDNSTARNEVPFQISYAISIHKAQGLEFNSVKIVITNEVEERISHNIFYTSITRAKERLKIYWSPETENKILSRLEKKFNGKDEALLKLKYAI